jgi:hypothetical protein
MMFVAVFLVTMLTESTMVVSGQPGSELEKAE